MLDKLCELKGITKLSEVGEVDENFLSEVNKFILETPKISQLVNSAKESNLTQVMHHIRPILDPSENNFKGIPEQPV